MTTEGKTMQAIVQDEYGTEPEAVLRFAEVDRPTIGADEVLVRVAAASVDRGTVHIMTGLPYPMRVAGFGLRRPKSPNPGRSFAGTVASVGKNVTPGAFAPGDEVYGSGDGSFAEYVVAVPRKVARKPVNLSFEQAAAVPISALPALQAVRDHAHVQPGQRVLINGASGGVGTFAVQIAKAYGAEVTGVVSTAKMEATRALGADHVIDYTSEDFADGTQRYDVILDIAGNRKVSELRRALTADGTLVLVGGEFAGKWFGGLDRILGARLLSPFVRHKLRNFISSENAKDLVVLKELIESGAVTPVIDKTFPLSETPAAISYVDDGHARGKVVVTV